MCFLFPAHYSLTIPTVPIPSMSSTNSRVYTIYTVLLPILLLFIPFIVTSFSEPQPHQSSLQKRFLLRRLPRIEKLTKTLSSEDIHQQRQNMKLEQYAKEDETEQLLRALLKRLAEQDQEPLVLSRYNRDCFFTPVNCFVGKAGEVAAQGRIVGTASNSRRQVLIVRRRHNKHNN